VHECMSYMSISFSRFPARLNMYGKSPGSYIELPAKNLVIEL